MSNVICLKCKNVLQMNAEKCSCYHGVDFTVEPPKIKQYFQQAAGGETFDIPYEGTQSFNPPMGMGLLDEEE